MNEPKLTGEEWELLIELLENERSNLPPEIHHTRTAEVRERLHARLDLINHLLERLREPAFVGNA